MEQQRPKSGIVKVTMRAEKTMVLGRCIVKLTMKKLCLFVLETKLETITKNQFKQLEKSRVMAFQLSLCLGHNRGCFQNKT